jgi:hypothetical protein
MAKNIDPCPGEAFSYITPPNDSFYECPLCNFWHLVEDACPSGKAKFEKKIEALLCVVHWEFKDEIYGPRPIRAYLCRLCGTYHVTSQLPRPKEIRLISQPKR